MALPSLASSVRSRNLTTPRPLAWEERGTYHGVWSEIVSQSEDLFPGQTNTSLGSRSSCEAGIPFGRFDEAAILLPAKP